MLKPCGESGILLAEHLVEQRAFVVVHQVGPVLLVEVQQAGQLQRVVADTVLTGVVGQLPGDGPGLMEVLVVAGPADGVGVVPGNHLPEVHRGPAVEVSAGLLPQPQAGDELGHGGVGVYAVQPVLVAGHRVQHPGVVEPFGRQQVALLAGDRVQVRERLRQAAVLDLQDPLHVRVAEPPGAPVHPVAQRDRGLEREFVAGQLVLVDEAGQVLVDHVVRRPHRPARFEPVEEVLRERGQVAGAEPGPRRAAPAARPAPVPGSGPCPGRSGRRCWPRSGPAPT